MRRIASVLLTILFLLSPVLAEQEKTVYRLTEPVPFDKGTETFDLYVCPLLGGDCMLLTCCGEIMLVDMGKANDYAAIRDVLDGQGITYIDIAFNTHPHTDHLGSMIQILADYPVGRFMTAFPEDYTGNEVIQVSTLRALHEAQVPVITVDDGYAFSLGEARVQVIRQTRYGNPNPMSAMLKITYGERSILLCADVIGSAQGYLAETHDLKADIFKYPHHGLNSVMREFLLGISPEYAVITHGYANTAEAQMQLDRAGIPYDFATWGEIHLSTDGQTWRVYQRLNENGIVWNEKYRKETP